MIALYIILGIIAFIIAFIILNFLFAIIVSLFIKNKDYDHNSRFCRNLLYWFTFWATVFVPIKVKFKGKEKLKQIKGRFLLVSNHRSNYDPILAWWCFRKYDVAFISKPQNFKIPFFGKIVRKCCFMAIDRENPRNAFNTIKRATDLIKKDEVSICVYPEGTRSKRCVLLPFHDGVFKIAKNSGVPIIVTGIKGTEKIHKNYLRRLSRVDYEILEVFDEKYVETHSTHEISARARQLIADYLGENKDTTGENK